MVVRWTLATRTSLTSSCTHVTSSVPVGLRVCPREFGCARVTVLPESRRAVTGRTFTWMESVGGLGRVSVWRTQPARVWLGGHGHIPGSSIVEAAVVAVPLPVETGADPVGPLVMVEP